jgi:hypothetical protein
MQGGILLTGSLPTAVTAGGLFAIAGRAVYDISIGGTRYTDYPVKGGALGMTVIGPDGSASSYGGIHSDTAGGFTQYLQAPAKLGNYSVVMTISDKTFSARRQLVFRVVEPPAPGTPPTYAPPPRGFGTGHYEPASGDWVWDAPPPPSSTPPVSDLAVYSEGIYFSNDHPRAQESITIAANILYWASNLSMRAESVPVSFYIRSPGAERQLVDRVTLSRIALTSPDYGSRYVFATWTNPGSGIYIVEAEIDPAFADAYKSNNAATRAIITGELASHAGTVSGHVTDIWGGVPGAFLEVIDELGGSIGTAFSDELGFYVIPDVPLGKAEVRIATPHGFDPDAWAKSASIADQCITNVDFFLTAQSNRPPVCKCHDVTVTSEGSSCGGTASVDFGSFDPDGNLKGCTQSPSGAYPLGPSRVTLECIDLSGVTCTCEAFVTVRDENIPTISCPASATIQVSAVPPVTEYGVSAGDDCGEPAISCSPPVGSLVLGQNRVTCTATDGSGNVANCSFDAYLNASPIPACSPVSVVADASCQATVSLGAGTIDPDRDSVSCQQAPATGEPLGLGEHEVRLVCTDDHGGSASCTTQATVVDRTSPVLACPGNQVLECRGGQATLAFETSAQDNCGTTALACEYPSGGSLPFGTVVNHCSATDLSGNRSSCSFTVEVRDTVPPYVTTRDVPMVLWPGNHKYVDFSLADCITAVSDDCGGGLAPNEFGRITKITSDEAEDDKLDKGERGDGDTCNDAVITGRSTARLRSERMGTGSGRVYRVHFEVNDVAGNTTSGSCKVVVPHDQSGQHITVEDTCAYCVGDGCGSCPTHRPDCNY